MPAIRNGRTGSAHHRTTGSFELPSATAYDGILIRPGALVNINTQRGARSAVVRRLFNSNAQSQAHVQWLKRSYAGAGAELFLDSTCTNVRITSVLCTIPGDVRFAAEPGVWRDPLTNKEVFTAMKEVARLKPDVFILENVPGICTPFKHGGHTLSILAQVVRKLVGDLGYQVRLGKLNSRDYGSPQDRHRIFVLAVRPGLPLPSWPTPTHANPKPKTLSFTAGDETVVLGSTASGPRRAVTARDAIGGMPNVANGTPFNYDYLEALVLPNGGVGVPNGAPYRRPPMTSYQKAARGRQVGVRDHFTPYPSPFVLDLVRHAPRADEPRAGPGAELRCDPHGAVPTIQSNPFPGRKSTLTIHWNAHRVLSVAERRRVQGLPDSYILRGSIKDKDTMLGNMVDVHVAKAFAAHIKREVFAQSWRAWGRPASVDFWRMWRAAHPV
ncbi:hypothetical protein CcaverHIS002_0508260 [Cutaneotrichosporon cavernicola]|nr:hypothetical protein CcaverHIS002_0508260 [Cutaneotrichosporon cavernicola]